MTAWGVVTVCALGGGAAGPLLDRFARGVGRATSPVGLPSSTDARLAPGPGAGALAGATGRGGPSQAAEAVSVASPGSRAAELAEGAAAALVAAAACALAALRLGAAPQLPAYCVLAGALVVVSVTDLRVGLVPRRVVYGAGVLVGAGLLCASAAQGTWRPMLDALAGGAIAFAVFGAVWWISPKAMGFGDVRLAGLCGAALGWLGFAPLYLGFLAAFVLGAVFGAALLVVRGSHRFPFAPALALGTMFGVLWGAWLGGLWLHFG